jgi:putative transposase
LGAELTEHPAYKKNCHSKLGKGNARNGAMSKILKSQPGEVEILSPRDRDGSFETQLLRKNQMRLTQMDDQILTLYAKGLSPREIAEAFKEMCNAVVSVTLIYKVTDRVLEQITAWESRPLDAIYPIVYLDCIVIKIRNNMWVVTKSIYLALGVNMDGHKDLLGLWVSKYEGAKFWFSVLTELKSRSM